MYAKHDQPRRADQLETPTGQTSAPPLSTTGADTPRAIEALLCALRQALGNAPQLDDAIDLSLQRAIRAKQVMQMTGDKRSHFYARLNSNSPSYDPTFPRPFRLGTSSRAPTVWWAHEILNWLDGRAKSARKN